MVWGHIHKYCGLHTCDNVPVYYKIHPQSKTGTKIPELGTPTNISLPVKTVFKNISGLIFALNMCDHMSKD